MEADQVGAEKVCFAQSLFQRIGMFWLVIFGTPQQLLCPCNVLQDGL